MPPTLSRGRQLLRRVLRVVDENVRALGKLAQLFVKLRIAGLVVGGVHHDAAGSFDAVAKAALRVIDVPRGDFVFTDNEGVAAADFHEFLFSGHG